MLDDKYEKDYINNLPEECENDGNGCTGILIFIIIYKVIIFLTVVIIRNI